MLEDYQIVNGCQTSYVMHENRGSLTEDVMVPVRLIATADEQIRNAIIKATNRQTQVTEEQLFALSEFPKKLEEYFPSFASNHRLFYERRSRQYNSDATVEKTRVVSQTTLVRSFASMFLGMPHRTTRNYKALLRQIGNEIFGKDHQLEPYYVAAYAQYRLDVLFRRQLLASELKAARYHLLLAFRLLATDEIPPKPQAKDMIRYSNQLRETLWNDEKSRDLFEKAAGWVFDVADGTLHRDNIRTEPFTQELTKRIREDKPVPAAPK